MLPQIFFGRTIVRLFAALVVLPLIAATAFADAPHHFVIFFTEWSAKIDDAGLKAIAAAAKEANEQPGETIQVIGYADPTGSKQANIDISTTRAQLVSDELVNAGVAVDRIKLGATGSVDFQLTSLESRRVEIILSK